MRKPTPGYEKKYSEKAKTLDVMYYTPFEELRGYMNGKSPKQVIEFFERLDKCTCGGEPKVKQIEGMGELDTMIVCKSCGRSINQSDYDRENSDDPGCEELALRKWNAGMTQEEIDRIKEEKWEKKRLHEEDLIWHPVHPNNMPCNGVDGIYCLLFKKSEKSIYCCKWTIEYQQQEKEPMLISSDAPIEAYILHMKRYFEVKARYYLHNIILGILGKTGGVPWIVDKMPSGADCFVGLDVAMMDKGLHCPACSVVFDAHGRMLGFFKPRMPQRGEKITTEILQDVFDQVILSYEDTYGEKPRNIVIHRDGFSNEDAEWYEHYFKAQNINYSIIEVRKNVGAKVLEENSTDLNPAMGACVFNDNKAYLVSTLMKGKKGSPNPLVIERTCGDISMTDAVTQVLYLTQLHVGSTQKPRLPITTGYADKICKNLEYVPTGKVENKLFFL